MKKSMLFIGIAAVLLGACSGNEKKLAEDSAMIAGLKMQYNEASSFNDSLLLLMGDIYTGLDSINQQEGLLYKTGGGEGVDRREEIRRNLSSIRERLAANKALLAELQKKAAAAGQNNTVLNKTIEQLKARLAEQENRITQLNSELEQARTQIADLTDQVAEGEKKVEEANAATAEAEAQTVAAENEANKVYYAIGTNKELKKNGLLEKKFLGATKVLKGDFNQSYFTVADKRTLSSIPTGSKKVKVKTNMPEDSYEIVGDKSENKILKITNPTKFWSLSPYLIIEVD